MKFFRRASRGIDFITVVHQGWLLQIIPRRWFRKWSTNYRWRWFVLRHVGDGNYALDYYSNATCTDYRGTLDLSKIKEVHTGLTFGPREAIFQRNNMLAIITSEKEFRLVAEEESSIDRWAACISSFCRVPLKTSFRMAKSRGVPQEELITSRSESNTYESSFTTDPHHCASQYILLSECFSKEIEEDTTDGTKTANTPSRPLRIDISQSSRDLTRPPSKPKAPLVPPEDFGGTTPDLRLNHYSNSMPPVSDVPHSYCSPDCGPMRCRRTTPMTQTTSLSSFSDVHSNVPSPSPRLFRSKTVSTLERVRQEALSSADLLEKAYLEDSGIDSAQSSAVVKDINMENVFEKYWLLDAFERNFINDRPSSESHGDHSGFIIGEHTPVPDHHQLPAKSSFSEYKDHADELRDNIRVSPSPEDIRVSSSPEDIRVSSAPEDIRVSSSPEDIRVSSSTEDIIVSSSPEDIIVSSSPEDIRVSLSLEDIRVSSSRGEHITVPIQDPPYQPEEIKHHGNALRASQWAENDANSYIVVPPPIPAQHAGGSVFIYDFPKWNYPLLQSPCDHNVIPPNIYVNAPPGFKTHYDDDRLNENLPAGSLKCSPFVWGSGGISPSAIGTYVNVRPQMTTPPIPPRIKKPKGSSLPTINNDVFAIPPPPRRPRYNTYSPSRDEISSPASSRSLSLSSQPSSPRPGYQYNSEEDSSSYAERYNSSDESQVQSPRPDEVSYIDLAFEDQISSSPRKRETVYNTVDFIKTKGLTETRQNVEKNYKNS